MAKGSEVQIGRAGELIASGIIEALGYRTVLCQQSSFDMLLLRDNETHYRVEVKTTSRPHGKPTSRYSWNTACGSKAKRPLDPSSVDLLCLVALDIRRCYFRAVFEHKVVRFNLPLETILLNDEKEQLDYALEQIDLRRNKC